MFEQREDHYYINYTQYNTQHLHVVFPLLGGPRTAILIGTTGLGDGCLRYNIGSAMNCSRACDEDKK